MPLAFTHVPLPVVGSSPAAIYSRGWSTCCTGARLDPPWRRSTAGGGQHVAQGRDWTHRGSIGSGGLVGEAAGERRRRDRGGTSAPARIPANGSEKWVNKRPWKLS
jgi:hypothetical protein